MKKIIFSKFSNDRASKFNIETQILEEGGVRRVRKIPYSSESVKHVEEIYNWGVKLEKRFENSNLRVNRCRLENSVANLDYVEGNTFEQLLDKCIIENDREAFNKMISSYVQMIYDSYKLEPFSTSDEFEKVFGRIECSGEMLATRELNIDMIFPNLFKDEERWIVIDYEWTFDFLIPIKFLFYRGVFYYVLNSPNRNNFAQGKMWELFDISAEEKCMFEKMDNHFQRIYTVDNYSPFHQLYKSFGKEKFDINSYVLETKGQLNQKNCNCKIYYDFGEGFSEKNSTSNLIFIEKDGQVSMDFMIPGGLTHLRIDPGDRTCVVSELELIDIEAPNIDLNYTTNSAFKSDDNYLFLTEDPQIILKIEDNRERVFRIKLKISFISNTTKDWINQYLNNSSLDTNVFKQIENLSREKEELSEEREGLIRQREDIERKLEVEKIRNEEMIKSTSWKITKPLRSVAKIVKPSEKSSGK